MNEAYSDDSYVLDLRYNSLLCCVEALRDNVQWLFSAYERLRPDAFCLSL